MTDRDAFIRAIQADPADDTPRLVFADWLDEDHAGRDPERAEFIRVQVELAKMPPPPDDGPVVPWRYVCEYCAAVSDVEFDTSSSPRKCHSCGCGRVRKLRADDTHAERRAELRARERELFGEHAFGWLEEMQSGHLLLSPYAIGEGGHKPYLSVGWALGHDRQPAGYYSPRAIEAVFRRGFVEELTCTAGDWLAHADALTAQHPVRGVTLTAWPDLPHTVRRYRDQREPLYEFDVAGKLIVAKMSEVPPGDDITLLVLRKRWPRVTFRRFMASGTEGTVTVGGQAIPVSSWTLAPVADPS